MFVQAIVTKFVGPTNTRPARIKATAAAGSVTIHYDHGKGINANHTAAAHALARKYGWTGTYRGGGMPDGNGNVYVSQPTTLCAKNRLEDEWFSIERDPKTGEAVPFEAAKP